MCIFKVVLPLPKCLHNKASPRIIWPHRNIQPHPVSDVGPVPPETHSKTVHEIPQVKKEEGENQDESNLKPTQTQLKCICMLFCHLPIGGKFFLYVNHSREVTSDRISSFSTRGAEITIVQLQPQRAKCAHLL